MSNGELCRPGTPQRENQRKRKERQVFMEHEILIGAFGMLSKDLIKGLEELEVRGQAETNQTQTLLRLARILRRVLET